MSIAKPFTFTANTYAKASEVNADFDVVYGQVNTNISAIAQNATDIDNLENNKANINGSYAQRFAVADPVNSNEAVNRGYLLSHNLPPGFIIHVALSSAPDGYLVCYGQEVSKTQYPDLYTVIGDTFGTPEDNDNFVIPDLIDKFIQGNTTVGTKKEAKLPNIKGRFTTRPGYNIWTPFDGTGSFYEGGSVYAGAVTGDGGGDTTPYMYFDASRSSSVYDDDTTTVQPPALTLLPLIKY